MPPTPIPIEKPDAAEAATAVAAIIRSAANDMITYRRRIVFPSFLSARNNSSVCRTINTCIRLRATNVQRFHRYIPGWVLWRFRCPRSEPGGFISRDQRESPAN